MADYTFTNTNSRAVIGGLICVRGVDPDNPVDITLGSQQRQNTPRPSAPTVTTVTNNARLILGQAVTRDITLIPTSGNEGSFKQERANSGMGLLLCWDEQATAGATGDREFTNSGGASAAESCAFTLALRPAQAGVVPTIVDPAGDVDIDDPGGDVFTTRTLTLTDPVGAQGGDLLIAWMTNRDAQLFDEETEWTTLWRTDETTGDNYSIYLCYRFIPSGTAPTQHPINLLPEEDWDYTQYDLAGTPDPLNRIPPPQGVGDQVLFEDTASLQGSAPGSRDGGAVSIDGDGNVTITPEPTGEEHFRYYLYNDTTRTWSLVAQFTWDLGAIFQQPVNLVQLQTIDQAVLSFQAIDITADDMAQDQVIGAPNIQLKAILDVDDVAQTQSLELAVLTVRLALAPDGIVQDQTLGFPNMLSFATLTPDGVAQDQFIGTPGLALEGQFGLDDLGQSQVLGEPTLTGFADLSVSGVIQTQTLGLAGMSTRTGLTVDAIGQDQAIEQTSLTLTYTFSAFNLGQDQTIDSPTATISGGIIFFIVDSMAQDQVIGSPGIGESTIDTAYVEQYDDVRGARKSPLLGRVRR